MTEQTIADALREQRKYAERIVVAPLQQSLEVLDIIHRIAPGIIATRSAVAVALEGAQQDASIIKRAADALDAKDALLREAIELIQTERNVLAESHSVGGELRIDPADEGDRIAAVSISDMDAWLARARAAIPKRDPG